MVHQVLYRFWICVFCAAYAVPLPDYTAADGHPLPRICNHTERIGNGYLVHRTLVLCHPQPTNERNDGNDGDLDCGKVFSGYLIRQCNYRMGNLSVTVAKSDRHFDVSRCRGNSERNGNIPKHQPQCVNGFRENRIGNINLADCPYTDIYCYTFLRKFPLQTGGAVPQSDTGKFNQRLSFILIQIIMK